AEKRAALLAVKTEIAQYENHIRKLRKEQQKLEDSLVSVVYPILTLPNEITSQIFTECLPADGLVRPSPRTAPLLVAQICRHWREVALATCELWSSVEFQKEGRPPLIESWFSRAKGHPLALSL
ncbi:hypothetical protein C8R43DRAFT_824335, partial [Mycena crocata]